MSVSGAAHGGKGPGQSSGGGGVHGGKAPGQTSVSGMVSGANTGQLNKAMTSHFANPPRSPAGIPAAQQIWRSATDVMTRGNSRFAKHAGAGPLTPEVVEQLEDRHVISRQLHAVPPHGDVLKSCDGCGRTYTLRKGMEGCPSCANAIAPVLIDWDKA